MMTENEYQELFLDFISRENPNNVYVPKLNLRYAIGKYSKSRILGMPDCELDVVEFSETEEVFNLWELKTLENNEIWNGKFFGQLMLYNFLFSTEPWNECFGRFVMADESTFTRTRGDINKVYAWFLKNSNENNTVLEEGEVVDGEPITSFSSWNLLVCGGDGYELAAGFNPVIWSFWILGDEYFKESMPKFNIYHFFKGENDYEFKSLRELNLKFDDRVNKYAKEKLLKNYPNFFSEEE